MLCRLDGTRTFEQAAREVYRQFRGGFSSVGLLNFYRWLYQEDLILCECDSIFELVEGPRIGRTSQKVAAGSSRVANPFSQSVPNQTASALPASSRSAGSESVGKFDRFIGKFLPKTPRQVRWAKVAAVAVFGLAVLRLAYVAAPILEPPVNRLYAEIENYFYDVSPMSTNGESIASAPDSTKKSVNLAGSAIPDPDEPLPDAAAPAEPLPEPAPQYQPEPAGDSRSGKAPETSGEGTRGGSEKLARDRSTDVGNASNVGKDTGDGGEDPGRLDELRRRLAECRIRRDEFYIQNDESGYRREVAKMSELAREIGEMESAR